MMAKQSGTEEVTHPEYVPSVAAHGEGDLEPEDRPLSETVLCVRYNGSSNYRILNTADLSGNQDNGPGEDLVWTPGFEVPWSLWLSRAGSTERALEVLGAHSHEFELVGPGADEVRGAAAEAGAEEFAIGGSVA
jgi:hypothetical protein